MKKEKTYSSVNRSTTESMDKLIVLLATQLELPLYPLLLTLNESVMSDKLGLLLCEVACRPF